MGWSQRPTGLIHYQPANACRGYTLFSSNGGDDAYLIDMDGNFVHRWHSDGGINYGFLLPNGNLLFRDRGSNPNSPSSNAIREFDWEGNLIWEYRNPNLRRHCRLTNGNNLFLCNLQDELSPELTRQVQGGFSTPSDPERMGGDLVLEVKPDGSTVSEWRSSEHLDSQKHIICPLEHREAWGGANDISAPDDSIFLISFRVLDTVAIVDRATGDFKWQWGPGQISHQHNPTLLSNGNVLLLDNGAHRRGLSSSRIVEVDPATNEIVWQYLPDPLVSFFTHFTGGAERLPNGNTLITEGMTGRLFEVTPSNQIVWEYISPFLAKNQHGLNNGVFRAHRYGPDYLAFSGRQLDPKRHGNLNRLYGGVI